MVRRQHGQAAVESVGITIAIALLLAAMSLWLARQAQPPARPPDVLGTIAGPLDPGFAQGIHTWSTTTLPFLDTMARGRGDRPIGRLLRTIGRGVATGAVLAAEGDRGFTEGFRHRLRERAAGLLDNPFAGLTDLPDPALLTPTGLADWVLARADERAGDLRDYIRRLRTLPPRVAAHTVGRDLGEAAADLGVDVAEAALRKRLARGLGGRVPRTPRPGGPRAPAP